MRKIFVIFFMAIHLAGNTEVGQLLKAPRLISHYFQHHRQDPSIDFLEFIAMHYFGDDGTTADDDFDNQLPCHNINHNTLAVVFSPMVKDISPVNLNIGQAREYSTCLHEGVSSKHVLLILQPPRLV